KTRVCPAALVAPVGERVPSYRCAHAGYAVANFTMSNSALLLSSKISSRGALRPSFALLRPDRGADGAPRGAPGVGPHARRMGAAGGRAADPCAGGRPPLGAPTVALAFPREPAFA